MGLKLYDKWTNEDPKQESEVHICSYQFVERIIASCIRQILIKISIICQLVLSLDKKVFYIKICIVSNK